MPSEVLAVGDAEVLVITETVVELLEVATQGPPGSGSGGPAAWNDITGKPSTFPPSVHTHTIDAVTGLQTVLDGKQAVLVNQNNIKSINGVSLLGSGDITVGGGGTPAWDDITGKPSTFPPSTHSHAISDVTDLQNEIGNRVRYDAAQSLTTGEATQARSNIGAASAATLSTLLTDLGDLTTDLSAVYVTAKT